jgi:hypothetical protein
MVKAWKDGDQIDPSPWAGRIGRAIKIAWGLFAACVSTGAV